MRRLALPVLAEQILHPSIFFCGEVKRWFDTKRHCPRIRYQLNMLAGTLFVKLAALCQEVELSCWLHDRATS